mgnify:CR=1 FL=1
MKKVIILIIALLFLTTGCTKSFIDKESEKQYTKNILCQPTTEEVKEVYINNQDETNVDITKLSTCNDFKVTDGGYEGLWTSIFVKPLAWLIINIGKIVKNYGIAIMLLGIALRLILLPMSKKTMAMSENMKKAKPELDKIERKYKDKTDQQSMMMKSQEMMLTYKKYNISPVSSCLVAFIQLPILFAFLEAIQRVPVIFEEKLWIFHLGTTPWEGITNGNYYYIIIVLLILITTYLSFKNMNNISMDEMQAKQMNIMNKFMVGFITIMSFGLPTALAFYWIVSSGFAVVQNIIQKKIAEKK